MNKLFLFLIVFAWSVVTHAQNLTKTGVLSMKLRNSGAIIQDDQVRGYYFFYNQEKQDRKNNNYLLTVTDENLREINSINIVRPTTYTLVEGSFNGDAFGFMFYDSRGKSVELIAYDRTLKQTGSTVKRLSSKIALAALNQVSLGNQASQSYLVPVSPNGFLYYGIKDGNKYHYEVEFYDNAMKRKWMNQATVNANVELASEAFQDGGYVGSLIARKKSASAKDIDFDLLVQDAESGAVMFRIPVATDQYNVSLSDVYFDKNKQGFVIFGEYYNKTDKELKDQSQGFITLELDMQGKIKAQKINSWATEISQVTPINERGKFDGLKANILFHNTIRTNDGQIFVIGEQYKKVASAAGIANQVLNIAAAAATGYYSSSTAAVQLNVYNMVIFQFNPDFTVNKVHVFEKDKNVVMLPAGAGYSSSKMLSYYAKAIGGFDYVFSQVSSDRETFAVAYINYDREKGQKGKNVLGSVVYTPERTFFTDKLVMNRKSTDYYVFRAKEGYVMVTEYFKKERRLESRLEKINY